MKELLVFQAGGTANRLGVHFWNIQEAYFHAGTEAPVPDMLWMSGVCPRLLALDHKDKISLPELEVPQLEERAELW